MNDRTGIRDPFVCLVRHGETELSQARCYNGSRDVALTARGEEEAQLAAGPLRGI